jgi:hypothetical protein
MAAAAPLRRLTAHADLARCLAESEAAPVFLFKHSST